MIVIALVGIVAAIGVDTTDEDTAAELRSAEPGQVGRSTTTGVMATWIGSATPDLTK